MGILDIFKSKPEKSKSKTENILRPEQKALIKSGTGSIQKYADNPPPAPKTAAPLTADQINAQQMARTAAGQMGDISSNMTNTIQRMTSGEFMDPNSPILQNYIQAAVRPIVQNTTESVLPGIRAEADAGGNFSSTRKTLADLGAMRDMGRNIGDTTSKIVYDAFGKGQDTMARGAALSNDAQTMALRPSAAVAAVGEQNQRQTEREMADKNLADQWDLMVGKELLGASNMMPMVGQKGVSTTTAAQASPAANIIGGAANGMAMGGPWGALAGGIGGGLSLFG